MDTKPLILLFWGLQMILYHDMMDTKRHGYVFTLTILEE